jgi:flagellar basal-body rod protein FlgF
MTDIGTQVSTSLNALTQEFDIVAHNLANASTAGYKRRCNAFTRALDAQAGGAGDGTITEEAQMPLDFSQGSLVQTDRTLDFALYGKGFFVIETPEGPLYTRHGVFQMNPNGQIVDLSGRVVAGVAGPISLPTSVDPSDIDVAGDGRISAHGAAIGQFRVVEFPDAEDQLVPAGDTCFRVPPEVQPVDVLNPVVRQGYQEASNVRIVDELVNLITVSRLYEANMRLASVMKETSSSMINVAMG